MKKLVALLLACMLILAAAAAMAEPSGTVMLYSSLKEKQLVAVKGGSLAVHAVQSVFNLIEPFHDLMDHHLEGFTVYLYHNTVCL